MNTDILPMNCWLEGEIYGGKITKGQRLISDRGHVVGVFNRDLTVEETQSGMAGQGRANPDYFDLARLDT